MVAYIWPIALVVFANVMYQICAKSMPVDINPLAALEVGFIYAYKAGWQVNTAAIVQSAFLAVALIFVGLLLYHEPMTWNKLAGVGICVVGLVFINLK